MACQVGVHTIICNFGFKRMEIRNKGLFGRLKEIRGKTSQRDFSSQLGIHWNTYANYEIGKRNPDSDFIVRLCVLCSVNPIWLLFGKGPKGLRFRSGEPDEYYTLDQKNPPLKSIKWVIRTIEEYIKDNALEISPEKKADLLAFFIDEPIRYEKKEYEHFMERMKRLVRYMIINKMDE